MISSLRSWIVCSLRSKNKWGWFFCEGRFVFKSFFHCSLKPLSRAVALSRPRLKHQPAIARLLLKTTSTQEGWGLGFSRTRRPTDEGRAVHKKKTMKTTSQKKSNRLPQESKLVVPQTQTPEAPQPERVDTRLPIDSEARKANRTLPTEKVLALLQQQDRRLWELAEVVGKWIWVPPPCRVRWPQSPRARRWRGVRRVPPLAPANQTWPTTAPAASHSSATAAQPRPVTAVLPSSNTD